jgi:hypothetical protein
MKGTVLGLATAQPAVPARSQPDRMCEPVMDRHIECRAGLNTAVLAHNPEVAGSCPRYQVSAGQGPDRRRWRSGLPAGWQRRGSRIGPQRSGSSATDRCSTAYPQPSSAGECFTSGSIGTSSRRAHPGKRHRRATVRRTDRSDLHGRPNRQQCPSSRTASSFRKSWACGSRHARISSPAGRRQRRGGRCTGDRPGPRGTLRR